MKVSLTPYTNIFPKTSKKEKDLETALPEKPKTSNELVKESVQKQVADVQNAQSQMGENNPRVKEIMDKFSNGKKPTPEEINYLRRHAPGRIEYVERILREREVIELSMKLAPTKSDVQMVALNASKQLQRPSEATDNEIRAKHLLNAKHEYEKTDDYQAKPDHLFDREEKQRHFKHKKQQQPSTEIAIRAYEKGQIKKEIQLKETVDRTITTNSINYVST